LGSDGRGGVGFGETTYSGDMSGPLWKPTNQLDRDSFLKLLTTQLMYQDPLNPVENTDMIAQLAQFQALETSRNTEEAISKLSLLLDESVASQIYAAQSVSNSSAMGLIGKEVRMRQPTVSWDGKSEQIPIRVHLGNASEATIEIRNSDGDVVRTIRTTDKDAQNSATVYWDGMQTNGQTARIGNYLVSVQGSERNSALYTFVQETVEGVRFTETGVLVKIGGNEISMGEVLDVSREEGGMVMSQSSALSLMGKEVRARVDSIHKSTSQYAEYSVKVNGPANTQVNVELKNSAGKVVATLRGHTNEFGWAQLFWDGREMPSGEQAFAGEYRINVVGSDKNTGLYAFIDGVVDGLTSLTGDFKLKVGSTEIAMNNIISISTPKPAS
jgi:flagellar basal-body rod modification protein FlgD